jgi:hypothetical protein
MKTRRRRRTSVSTMMAEMILASWETMTRRAMLMAQNQCSPDEYRRMFGEKVEAAALSASKLMSRGGRARMTSVLAPWHRRVVANAKRLRKK